MILLPSRRLRALSSTPIILVTATDTPDTKIAALDFGGDDSILLHKQTVAHLSSEMFIFT